ncbi:iron ABC transporter permease, partial [Candidatus Gracilibacteria bacterium]|nr:iron ABC transporter permease [Candidatus Gracilibacteria bacterium]
MTTLTAKPAPTRATRVARSTPVLLLGLPLCAALLGLALMSSIAFGAADIAPSDVWAALFRFDPTSTDHLIIRTLRVPRAAVAALVGASLAVAGA